MSKNAPKFTLASYTLCDFQPCQSTASGTWHYLWSRFRGSSCFLAQAATDTSPFDCDRAAATTHNYQISRGDTRDLAACALLTFIHGLRQLGLGLRSRRASSKHECSRRPRRLWSPRHAASLWLWTCTIVKNHAVCSRPYLSSPAGLLTVKMWQDQWRDMSRQRVSLLGYR